MSLKYDLIKDKITIRMVPRDKGEALCCAFPDLHIYDAIHITIGGMCAVLCLGTKNNSIITDQTLDALNITEYEFKSDVFENAAKNNPAVMKSLVEIQGSETEFDSWIDITPINVFEISDKKKDKSIYVVSNARKQFGASVLVYPNFLKQAAKTIGGSFFVLPFSVHEIILVDDKVAVSADYLSDKLQDMLLGDEALNHDDYLTNVLYHYDAKANRLETSWEYVRRVAKEKSKTSQW